MRPTLDIDALKQWEDNGATWHAIEVTDRRAVVELCTCYGEPVDRLEGDGPELIEFVRAHRESDGRSGD
jgi:hypothetical protein